MEEDQVVEQQDDLERMIAHMRAEALKRGKDWLRAKIEDEGGEAQERVAEQPAPQSETNIPTATEDTSPTRQKAVKRQRAEKKSAGKPSKRSKAVAQDTVEGSPAIPETSRPQILAEGEHISTLIKECFKSLAPLLLRGEGAGLVTEGSSNSSKQTVVATGHRDRLSQGDPLPAWSASSKPTDTVTGTGNSPESYTRPSLGPPSMTTRAAGLAAAIPLTVKERIWRKEFVDIFTLLEIQLEGLDLTVCDKKDEDRRKRKRARKERNFENWLDAFRIMACVIVEKFPHCAADLWLYEAKIHEAHRQFPGDAWLEYDKSFRLKMQGRPEMEWNQEDVSSYIHKMMVAKEVGAWAGKGEQSFRTAHHKGRQEKYKTPFRHKPWHSSKAQGDKGSQAICWKFETDDCTWGQNCKFRHSCSACRGDHPATTCRKHKHKSDRKDKKKKQ
ncbi:hypothetical protein NDU88_003471 [Pleurodeles waltl]|uniref:C3H1-type domain-containing protein n=1 Tax=Pleurodeles waltl TaxID=8319 RepID=A0AAV7TQQ3_PLEWA|nr:hypothetical protein NDU88_003471 [Pleurodeles waltl]